MGVAAALFEAVRAGDQGRARALLSAHPDWARLPEAWNREFTALHYAVLRRDPALVRLLLEYGADPHVGISPLNNATSALTIARDRGYEEIADLLANVEPAAAPPPPPDPEDHRLAEAVRGGDAAQLRALLDQGLDPDARFRVEDGEAESFSWGAPLYACVRARRHDLARLLLERGADPNGRVYASGTPLSEAYGQQDEAMIALLEHCGGEPNASMAGLYRRKDLALRLLARMATRRCRMTASAPAPWPSNSSARRRGVAIRRFSRSAWSASAGPTAIRAGSAHSRRRWGSGTMGTGRGAALSGTALATSPASG